MAMKHKIKPAKGISPPRNAGQGISRMPRAVRDEVSQALEDGADWKVIRDICAKAGFQGVKPQNVTNYRKGAHIEWQRKQERLEAIRRDSDETAAVMAHYIKEGGSPAEAGLLAAAEIMANALHGMGPETMRILIAEDPKALFSITRELSRVADLLEKKSGQASGPESENKETAPSLTPEQRAAAMKEIFVLPT